VQAADEAGASPSAGSAGSSGPLLITLGSNAVYGPRFEGSKRHDIGPWPIISWRQQGEKEWLDMPTDGIDFALIETDTFRMGPVGYWRWQRDAGAAPRGFSTFGHDSRSIDLSVEAGAFAEYWPVEWLRTRLEVRESIVGASGLVAIASSDVVWKPDKAWTLAAGPRLSFGDARFMKSYYGVDAAQSITSGLPTYSAQAGLRSYGAGMLIRNKLSESWMVQGFADFQHLAGPAGDSPVISTRGTPDQFLVGMGVSYTFKAPW
jgi:outer membrane protein